MMSKLAWSQCGEANALLNMCILFQAFIFGKLSEFSSEQGTFLKQLNPVCLHLFIGVLLHEQSRRLIQRCEIRYKILLEARYQMLIRVAQYASRRNRVAGLSPWPILNDHVEHGCNCVQL